MLPWEYCIPISSHLHQGCDDIGFKYSGVEALRCSFLDQGNAKAYSSGRVPKGLPAFFVFDSVGLLITIINDEIHIIINY